jgi:hypothetical protein
LAGHPDNPKAGYRISVRIAARPILDLRADFLVTKFKYLLKGLKYEIYKEDKFTNVSFLKNQPSHFVSLKEYIGYRTVPVPTYLNLRKFNVLPFSGIIIKSSNCQEMRLFQYPVSKNQYPAGYQL